MSPARAAEFTTTAKRLIAPQNKTKFVALEQRTRVPWYVIAVIKEREAGIDALFLKNIANGQPWNAVTTIVPIGRGPFTNWFDAGVDALANCPPYAARWTDWSAGGCLTALERYNGLGYAIGPSTRLPDGTIQKYPPQASPYVWSGTDQYGLGKYVRDHVFDPNMKDIQLGCAGLLLAMTALDPSIKFGAVPAAPKAPASGSLLSWLISLFKR